MTRRIPNSKLLLIPTDLKYLSLKELEELVKYQKE